MSAWCDLALALGMTLGGSCQPAVPVPDRLPQDDPGAWEFKEPKTPPPAAPVQVPNFPPVVIREVQVPAPPPAPVPVAPKPTPAPQVVAPPQPNPIELAARAAYQSRSRGLPPGALLMGVGIPASLPRTGPGATIGAIGKNAPALGPLDLAAAVRSQGESKYEEKAITSTLPVDNSRIVTTDRYISVTVETGINTQLDGSAGGIVVLQVSRDVFGYHGRNILIPKGSRLVCGFKQLEKVGSSRAPMRCSRILLGGHRAEIFGMKANATDMQGALGVSGEVDNRFWERYGTAFILTGISTAVRVATTSTTTNETLAKQSNAIDTGGEELSQRFGEIAASSLDTLINLTPTLKVKQGTRVQIRPDTDWYIAKIDQQQE